jgi:hypothetical protein
LYSLHKHGKAAENDSYHQHYLDQFYQATRAAIDRQAYRDLVYGCFAGCMYALCVRRQFDEIAAHAVAFRLSASHLLATNSLMGEETFFIECMWEKLVWVMAREMLFPQNLPQ